MFFIGMPRFRLVAVVLRGRIWIKAVSGFGVVQATKRFLMRTDDDRR
jgi:hypothetical protein